MFLRGFTTLCMALGMTALVNAQGGIGIGLPGDWTVSVADVTAPLGGTFEIPVQVETNMETPFLAINSFNDPTQVLFSGWSFGSGLQAYIDQNGMPPSCDTFINPDGSGAMIAMFLIVPYDSSVYGTEFIKIEYDVVATQVGSTLIGFDSGSNSANSEVTIVDEEPFIRGDVNLDTSCNVVDVVKILGFLFANEDAPVCMDAADFDNDGAVNLSDPVLLLNSLFFGGEPLDEQCQMDTGADTLPNCLVSGC